MPQRRRASSVPDFLDSTFERCGSEREDVWTCVVRTE